MRLLKHHNEFKMKSFPRKSFSVRDIPANDNGVSVKSVIELVENNDYYPDLAKLLNVQDILDDFIEIPGAHKLVSSIRAQNKEFDKFDLKAGYNNLEFKKAKDGSFLMKFVNIEDEKALEIVGNDNFIADLKYSSESDFFNSTFGMDKYASTLTAKGYSDLVYKNLELLREIFKSKKSHEKFYRILKSSDNEYHLRAIVSDHYNDYSNNITVFLGLIVLHQEMQKRDVRFSVSRCEYNESFIRIYFEKTGGRPLEKIGSMKYIIELSNDEIKREALRFAGVASIIYDDGKYRSDDLFIKPDRLRSDLSAISHGLKPEKAIEKLTTLSKYVEREEEMYNDIQAISTIKSPDEVKFFIQNKIRNTKQIELRKYSGKIVKELNQRVNSLHDLFVILDKINLIVEDIEAKEHLRYLLYEGLIERKGRTPTN